MITTLINKEPTQLISGPAGKLELIVAEPIGEARGAWGIVCHPHPLMGGTMHNKVVTTLTKTFQHLGLHTVRFNFRGVGKSEGDFDQAQGEIEDLLAVIKWVESEKQQAIWLAGFSFGAYITAKVMTEIPVTKSILVAPPVENFPMQDLPAFLSPWVLVQGDKDEIVPAEKVFFWAENREPQPTVLRFPEATHFFHGQLNELRTRLEAVLK